MSVLTFNDVLETTQMITHHNLDVRTITMGISLRDCGHPDVKVCADKIYDKITKKAAIRRIMYPWQKRWTKRPMKWG